MAHWLTSAGVLDLVLLIVVAESLAVACAASLTRGWRPAADIVANLCSAAAILAAAHLVIVHVHRVIWVGVLLTLALCAHLTALRLRFRLLSANAQQRSTHHSAYRATPQPIPDPQPIKRAIHL